MNTFNANINLPAYGADSYKVTHWPQYPNGAEKIYSYLEARGTNTGYEKNVFFGLQYILKSHLEGKVVTQEDIDEAEEFHKLHFGRDDCFNREGWEYIVNEHNGRLPLKIRAVPEGSVVPINNVLMTIENTDPETYWLTNYMETLLHQVWYPITVATNSRRLRDVLSGYYKETCNEDEVIDLQMHDFGYRGVSSFEQAALGGAAHLTAFNGTDTLPGPALARKFYNIDMAGISIPACYDEETDILTDEGFIPFSELSYDHKVAQYEENGNISFVSPENIVEEDYEGEMVKFDTEGDVGVIDLLVTPNHRMVRESKKKDEIEIQEAENATFSNKNDWLQAGIKSDGRDELTALERLKIAFQADGAFPGHYEDYNGKRSGCLPIRFSMKKDRKVNRLKTILESVEFDYNSSSYENGYTEFWIKVPLEYSMEKNLNWVDLDDVSASWCRSFIDELKNWDATEKYDTITYSSADKDCAEIVQSIGILAGYRSSYVTEKDNRDNRQLKHLVHVSISRDRRNGQGINKTIEDYSGKIHCVTVPSGMVVVRRNGYVSVSGNSEHSTMTSWEPQDGPYDTGEENAFANMLKQYPGGLVSVVSDSYDIQRAVEDYWGGSLKDEVENFDGVLVIRPDSGDPAITNVKIFRALEEKFGAERNEKGYKVIPGINVIQGDGIEADGSVVSEVLDALKAEGFAASNIAFGSGGGLINEHGRDDYKFAIKCSSAVVNGKKRDVRKTPMEYDEDGNYNQSFKTSKSGELALTPDMETVHPSETDEDLLDVVFENGEVKREQDFEDIRKRARK
jgi:nicotinic acid phosphoribosyltransferase